MDCSKRQTRLCNTKVFYSVRNLFFLFLMLVLPFVFLMISGCEEEPEEEKENRKFTNGYEVIVSPDASGGDRFGCSIAVRDDYLIVGAECARSSGEDLCQGAAYIFHKTEDESWSQGVEILTADSQDIEKFGLSVAIEKNMAIVGAVGQAFIFSRSGENDWTQQAALSISDEEAPEDFGKAVAIDGEYALVGAPSIGSYYSKPGTAYLFQQSETDDWSQIKQFIPFNSHADDQFGASVAIEGDYAVVGAPEFGEYSDGSVFIYYRSNLDKWDVETRLPAPKPRDKSEFGFAVAIDGDFVIVGDMEHFYNNEGEALIFQKQGVNAWDEGTLLSATLTWEGYPYNGYEFGRSAAINGTYAIVGSPEMSEGAAFVFDRTDNKKWSKGKKIVAFGAIEPASFGYSVALNEDFAFVGDPDADSSGRIFVFQ